jgi:thioester reductase-like protein
VGDRHVLVTGGTGFIGKVLVERLVRRAEALGIDRITLLIRPMSEKSSGSRRFRRIAKSPCFASLAEGWSDRISVVDGDVSRPGLGLAEPDAQALVRSVTHIVHAAAAVEFDLPLPEAAHANIVGALEVQALARRCERLERHVHVSTAYVTPHPGDGVAVKETLAPLPQPAEALYALARESRSDEKSLLAATGHPNTYTCTKSIAEHLLSERAGDLPLVIARPSIVSAAAAEPFPGWIDSAAAFAGFVALIGMGQMRVVRADPEVRPDIVPVDWVARGIEDACFGPEIPIRHLVAGLENTPSYGDCLEVIDAYFAEHQAGERPPFVHYMGRSGLRFVLHDWVWHRLPLIQARLARRRSVAAEQMQAQVDGVNDRFEYFTHRSFDFDCARPCSDSDFDPRRYIETVCLGVDSHLLRRMSARAQNA